MINKILIDSNVWIYALMKGEDARIHAATLLIEQHESILVSTQIVNEVCSVLLRKHKATNATISDYIQYFYEECTVLVLEEATLKLASKLRIRYRFSFWDSLIVASALENNCTTLYSEDMQHQFKIEQLTLLNPFLEGK